MDTERFEHKRFKERLEYQQEQDRKIGTFVIGCAAIVVIGFVAFWGGLLYTGLHFLRKIW